MNKRVFTIMIALLLAAFVPKAYGQEAGDSADNPFDINDYNDLVSMKYALTKHYKLQTDITIPEGMTWTPPTDAFTGSLDGNGYTISGLKVSVSVRAGLFGYIGKNGTVKNLGVTGTTVTATSTSTGGYAGGIAGYSEGTIQNCYTSVAVTAASSMDGAGGIVGNNDGTILNCYTTGAVTNEAGFAGGIAGKNPKDIQKCYATGIIKGSKAGGITGENSLNTKYCIALNASITGTNTGENPGVGRIAGGTSADGFVTNYAAPSIPGAWEDKGNNKMNGTDLIAASFTAAIPSAFTNWSDADWDFSTAANLPILKGFKTANQPVKNVARAPFLLTTITDQKGLAAIKSNLSGSYKLGNDIPLSGDWTPLGEFTGTLDGDGYTINGLKVSVTDSNAGLFETIGKTGTVKNLGITSGSVTGEGYAGSIAGENNGTIENCYTNVTVTSPSSAGGIVGVNSLMIQNCYTTGTVTSEKQAGGIAGANFRMIQNCYTTGAVTCEMGKAGGIAGMNMENSFAPTIQYCYATGIIKGNQAGGIIGVISTKNTIASNCIALNDSIIGTNTGEYSGVGRIIGYKYEYTASLNDNHAALSIPGAWAEADKVITGISGANLPSSFGTDGADAGAFKDWEATNWDFATTANLPILKGFKTADQPVKERAPFLVVPVTTIKTQAELAAIKDNLSGSYKLGGSFTLSGNWKPLGDRTTPFTGTLDGCGYSISGLTVNVTGNNNAGLFGYIGKDGTVKNLGVTGSVTLTDATSSVSAGGIAALSYGVITNCYTNVTVSATGTGYTYAGGIAGQIKGDASAISNCFTTGNCTATSTDTAIAGGIVGTASPGRERHISYCYATGTVKAEGEAEFKYAGGIAGQKGGIITGCISLNKGGITGINTNRIAGYCTNGCTIANCYASPAILGTWSNIGADKLDGADLTNANFITSNDAFTGWNAADWTFGDNTNLPTLMTTGLTPNIALAGQTTIKRTDYLNLVLIDKAVTYDATLHKDKNLVIAPAGNLTVSAASAQVDSLEIQPGGQVTTTTALVVTKAISTSRALANKWSTFGAPVLMKFKAIESTHMLQGYESSEAEKQQWTVSETSSDVSLQAASPYLLAIDKGSETVSFSSDKGITIPVSAKAESGSALSNGIFLFRTNPSLRDQPVTNVYILSEDGTRFERQATYTLKPFECYVIANAATAKAVQSLRVGNGTPTGNDPIALTDDAFRLWGANGQLHLSADTPHDVAVYTLSGRLVRRFTLTGEETLALPRGIYLVNSTDTNRSTNITYKVSL